jgi:hypothetical protein
VTVLRNLIILALLLLPVSAQAGTFLGLGLGGVGGTAEAFHLTSSFGLASRNPRSIDGLLAGEVSLIFNNDSNRPDDINDYEIPHWDFDTVGTFQLAPELSIGMKIGIEPVPTSGLLITICGGTSITQRTEVVQSRATGWFYENGTAETSQTYYGVGLVYQPDNTNWALFAQFDRRRGGEIGYHMEL